MEIFIYVNCIQMRFINLYPCLSVFSIRHLFNLSADLRRVSLKKLLKYDNPQLSLCILKRLFFTYLPQCWFLCPARTSCSTQNQIENPVFLCPLLQADATSQRSLNRYGNRVADRYCHCAKAHNVGIASSNWR